MSVKILLLPLLLLCAGCTEKIEAHDVAAKKSGDVPPRPIIKSEPANTSEPQREEPKMVTPVALD